MDILSNLKYAKGAKKNKKRVGRGEGSGHGGQSTRGMNGQLSRSGANHRIWFEGGQMPLQRRVPKSGFTSPFKVEYQVINLNRIQSAIASGKLQAGPVDQVALYKAGLITSGVKPYKILGTGEISAKIDIHAHQVSESAKAKIEAAGGTVSLIQ